MDKLRLLNGAKEKSLCDRWGLESSNPRAFVVERIGQSVWVGGVSDLMYEGKKHFSFKYNTLS